MLTDVDGVLTDGNLVFSASGEATKAFSVKDGFGLQLAQRAGLGVGLLSARSSEIVLRRAEELGLSLILQGVTDKGQAFSEFLARNALQADAVAYIGDDLPDLPVLTRCGLAAAPADAAAEVRQRVHFVTQAAGGQGAVRELVERILSAQGKWNTIVQTFTHLGNS